jgi:hypothetical protein
VSFRNKKGFDEARLDACEKLPEARHGRLLHNFQCVANRWRRGGSRLDQSADNLSDYQLFSGSRATISRPISRDAVAAGEGALQI